MKQSNTIERCLEILAGYDETHRVDPEQLKSSDVNLMQSLGRQVLRGTPLTDRQYELAIVKCKDYYKQYNCNISVTRTKGPRWEITIEYED